MLVKDLIASLQARDPEAIILLYDERTGENSQITSIFQSAICYTYGNYVDICYTSRENN